MLKYCIIIIKEDMLDKEIEKIKEIIKKQVFENNLSIKKIILFGSRAGKHYAPDSDFDILIVIEQDIDIDKKILLFKNINNALASEFIPSDIIIKTEREFTSLSDKIGTVTYTAVKEGIAI